MTKDGEAKSTWRNLLPPPPGSSRVEEEARAKRNIFLQKALAEEKMRGQAIAVWARSLALCAVAILLVIVNPRLEVIYYIAFLVLFILLGLAQLRVARVGQSRMELFLIFLDILLLSFVMLFPNPWQQPEWPTAMQYSFDGFTYFYLLLASATLAYSWRTVAAFGVWTGAIWAIGFGLVWFFGTQIPELSERIRAAVEPDLRLFQQLDPNNPDFGLRLQEIVLFIMVAAILALKSWRSNELLVAQAEIAAERANLSRYFPPTMVDELASRNEPLGEVRSQDIAVLFADVVGFTKFAETEPPQEVVQTLRHLHALLEESVFANQGTLDKYLGDGIMATFGTPQTSESDATNALKAAEMMLASIEQWNAERTASGKKPVRLSVGVHFGPVILGNIGTERRLEFAALGDTVNVASRLEAATRENDCSLIASQALVARIGDETSRNALLSGFRCGSELALRGRYGKVPVWMR